MTNVLRISVANKNYPEAYITSVTQMNPYALVCRDALEIPEKTLSMLPQIDYIIIETEGHKSEMAFGYSEVLWNARKHTPVDIVGLCPQGSSLRPVPPREAIVLKNAKTIYHNTKHARNFDVAHASRAGVELLYKAKSDISDSVMLVWGGAVETHALEIMGERCYVDNSTSTFPEERRKEIINPHTVEAAAILSEYFCWRYYGEGSNYVPTEQKWEILLKETVIEISGVERTFNHEVSCPEVLVEIARRAIHKIGDEKALDILSSVHEKYKDQYPSGGEGLEKSIKKLLFPYYLISGYWENDGNFKEYTWYLPVNSSSIPLVGAIGEYEGIRGKEYLRVTKIQSSSNNRGHKEYHLNNCPPLG